MISVKRGKSRPFYTAKGLFCTSKDAHNEVMHAEFAPLRLIGTGLAVRRGMRSLFSSLSVTLEPGDVVQLTGPNGSGKSTLLRLMAGFSTPDEGKLLIEGLNDDVSGPSCLHYFGHREGLRAALTTTENLEFLAQLLGGDARLIRPRLDELGLLRLAHLPVRVLSEGQKRRVALARLVIVPRPIWLLDEPLASLDVEAIQRVAGLIAAHARRGGMAMVATHQPLPAATRSLELGNRTGLKP
jgi:heme exporter protein A